MCTVLVYCLCVNVYCTGVLFVCKCVLYWCTVCVQMCTVLVYCLCVNVYCTGVLFVCKCVLYWCTVCVQMCTVLLYCLCVNVYCTGVLIAYKCVLYCCYRVSTQLRLNNNNNNNNNNNIIVWNFFCNLKVFANGLLYTCYWDSGRMIHALMYKNVASHVEKKRQSKTKQISLRHVHCALSYVESIQCHQRYRNSQRALVKCDSNASLRYFCWPQQRTHFVVCLV
jgi:hypothetical protein